MKWWLVIRIKPQQYEKAAENIRNQRTEFYCPRILTRSPATRRPRVEPMFPGYAFARPPAEEWLYLKSTRGVQDVLLSTGERPAHVPPEQIAEIQAREGGDGIVKLEQHHFRMGERVFIEEGPMTGLLGVYDGMSSQDRVFVLLGVLGRLVRSQVPLSSVTKIP